MAAENDLANPMEAEMPYSARLELTPKGQGLMIDSSVILAVSRRINIVPPDPFLMITTGRTVPILEERLLLVEDGFWQEKVRRLQVAARIESELRYGTKFYSLYIEKFPVYIGNRYKLTYLGRELEGIIECFEINSTTQMQAVQISGREIFWQVLQRAQGYVDLQDIRIT